MKKTQLLVAFLSGSILVACGGSGGTSNPTATEISDKLVLDRQIQTSNSSGQYVKVNDNGRVTNIADINEQNIDQIVIDGYKISLSKSDYRIRNLKGWGVVFNDTDKGLIDKVAVTCCEQYNYARIGILSEDYSDDTIYYYGEPTKDVPREGIATYNGSAFYAGEKLSDKLEYEVSSLSESILDSLDDEKKIRYLSDKSILLANKVVGSTELTADFSEKRLTGLVKTDAVKVAVNSYIQGNNFIGTASSNMDDGVAKVSGGFYGPNAKELAGVAVSDGNWVAGFIAKKQ